MHPKICSFGRYSRFFFSFVLHVDVFRPERDFEEDARDFEDAWLVLDFEGLNLIFAPRLPRHQAVHHPMAKTHTHRMAAFDGRRGSAELTSCSRACCGELRRYEGPAPSSEPRRLLPAPVPVPRLLM